MNFISKIYKKLLIVYNILINSDKYVEKKDSKENIDTIIDFGSILFKIVEQDQIGIVVNIPALSKEYDSDNIISDAENYANFLVHITNGMMRNQLINLVKKRLNETEDPINKLFLENVLYFFPIIEDEFTNKILKYGERPLIRPTGVFNITPS